MLLTKRQNEYLWMPLLVASWLWASITFLRRFLYPYLWRYRCRIPVVCVGNVHSGGSGKTPLVIEVARHFNERRPIVVSRGYGGRRSRTGAKVSLETQDGAAEYGDEPWLLANRLRVPVYIGKRRAEVLRVVEALEDSRLVVMDDGFQHLAVHRDVDVVVINVEKSLKLRNTIPLGELREPLKSIGRAHCVCLVGDEEDAPNFTDWETFLKSRFPSLALFHMKRRLVGLEDDHGQSWQPSAQSAGYAFCGIGSPDSFRRILSPIADVKWGHAFSDHHSYSDADLDSVIAAADAVGAKYLVTTEKDWGKVLEPLRKKGKNVILARMKYEIPGEFWQFVQQRLEQ